jgi:hypothetical protein
VYIVVKIQFGVKESTKVLNRSGTCNGRTTEAIIVTQYVSLPGVRHNMRFMNVQSHAVGGTPVSHGIISSNYLVITITFTLLYFVCYYHSYYMFPYFVFHVCISLYIFLLCDNFVIGRWLLSRK